MIGDGFSYTVIDVTHHSLRQCRSSYLRAGQQLLVGVEKMRASLFVNWFVGFLFRCTNSTQNTCIPTTR